MLLIHFSDERLIYKNAQTLHLYSLNTSMHLCPYMVIIKQRADQVSNTVFSTVTYMSDKVVLVVILARELNKDLAVPFCFSTCKVFS